MVSGQHWARPRRRTSMEPTSRTRRMLIKAGIAGLATPAVAAAAQSATTSREGARFNLWVISDCHVGTDKAASAGIQHGLIGFRPPPVYPESLAEALRTSEEGGRFGGPPIEWDIALNLGDYAGFWDAPEDEQGREVIRQYAVLKQHRREQIYNIAGNHDASPFGAPSGEGKETNWWFRKWARSGRRAYRNVGRRSRQAAVSDRRNLGALHLQGLQHPLPDDERPQRPALSDGTKSRGWSFPCGRRDRRNLFLVEKASRIVSRRYRRELPSSHAAGDDGRVRRLRRRIQEPRRDLSGRKIPRRGRCPRRGVISLLPGRSAEGAGV